MRTTVEFPDPLFRELKAKAALEGVPLKEFVRRLVERGLGAPEPNAGTGGRSALPSVSTGKPLRAELLSNAGLYELLDGDE